MHPFPFSSWTLLTGGLRGKTTTSTSSASSPWRPQSTSSLKRILHRLRVHSIPLARWPICKRQSEDSLPDAAPSLRTGWTIQHIVTEEYRNLEGAQLRACNSYGSGMDRGLRAASFPCGANSNSSSRDAHSFRWYLPTCLLTGRCACCC